MNTRTRWTVAGIPAALLCSLLLVTTARAAAGADARRPNIILFLVDDMGWIDSSAYGSQYYETPNMERLAGAAMRFTDAYATPLCSPTRASILSGQYSARHGTTTASGHRPPQPPDYDYLPAAAPPNRRIVQPESRNFLELDQYTLAEALRDGGYRTAHLGKWHLGLLPQHWPDTQGFDVTFHCAPDPGPPSYFSPYGVSQQGRPTGRQHVGNISDGPEGEYITDRLTDEAIEFIKRNRDEPFFLNLWHYGVHGPWGHKEAYTAEFAQKTDPRNQQRNPIMASMLKSIDESLGRVLDTLDALQLTENTCFIFYSDNGGNVHSNVPGTAKTERAKRAKPEFIADWRRWAGNEPPTSNAPLRAGKGTLYEGGCRVPLMVRWPGIVHAGTTSDAVVGPIDLYPTILDLLGIPQPAQQTIDGQSFAAVLRGGEADPQRLFFNYFPHGGPQKPGGVWVRQGDWKLIRWFETGPDYPTVHELYNLRDDIAETNNLADQYAEKVADLDARIDQFFVETGALTPQPNPAYKPASAGNRAQPESIDGWIPKGCTLVAADDAWIVLPEGRHAMLTHPRLSAAGPARLMLRYRGKGGAASVQWRTAAQDRFPADGQTKQFTLPASDDWTECSVVVPVEGTLRHARLYLPASRLELGAIEIDAP